MCATPRPIGFISKTPVQSLLLCSQDGEPQGSGLQHRRWVLEPGQVSDIQHLEAARINLGATYVSGAPSYRWDLAKEEMSYIPIFDIDKGVRDFIEG